MPPSCAPAARLELIDGDVSAADTGGDSAISINGMDLAGRTACRAYSVPSSTYGYSTRLEVDDDSGPEPERSRREAASIIVDYGKAHRAE